MPDGAGIDLLARAVAHHRDGRLRDAIRAYHAALEADPANLEAYGNLGGLYVGLRELENAEGCWRSVIAVSPFLPAGHNNLGATLRSLGRPAEAVEAFQAALRLQPVYPEASNNLGAALCELARFEEAVPHYLDAIRATPNYPKALCNLGSALRDLRRFEEALAALSHAVRLAPDFAEAHVVAAELLLLTGRLAAGWTEFEWRTSLPRAGRRSFHAPAWRGGPVRGTVLVHAEDGLGDTIQFCRFVPTLAARGDQGGHRVLLEVQAPLRRLLAPLPGIAGILAAGDTLPAHDLQCPLLSLPLALGTSLGTIPAETPYLAAAPEAVARWRARLSPLPGRAVGLVWAGNPDYPADLRRSIPLARFAALAGAPEVSFVSLQKGAAARQATPDGLALHDWTEELADMADTAALVAALDLVIGVDTAVVHLAGALGKPVWLLNRFDTDWRWLLDRADSPWYPTLRIFRQPAPGDWDTPLAGVREALAGAPEPARVSAIQVRPEPGDVEDWERSATLDRLAARAMRAGDFEAAATHSQEAVRLQPRAPWMHNNLANAWRVLGRLPEALAAYEDAARLSDDPIVRYNVGHVLRDLDRLDEAEATYREIIRIRPELAEAHAALGGLLLETGRFTEGWSEFAWRTRNATFNDRPFEQPMWDGSPQPDKTVLIYSDEGLGDAIQFCRYVPRASALTRVILESPPQLAPLFASVAGPASRIVHGEAPGPFDFKCPLLDLPRVLGTTLETIPGETPYLGADPVRVAAWRERVARLPQPRVGLVWSGNPANLNDRTRSMPPAQLRPLIEGVRDGSFVSLQKSNDRVGVAIPGAEAVLHDWTDELHDMSDTAALIEALDLVVGVDTAVIHLAGALGKPVWLLNRYSTDWRWLRDRSDSPWYPTMRIFRQPRVGAWEPVIDAARAALLSFAP